MPYALIIDIVVAILLIVTIVYAVGLNRRLTSMRRDRHKLEKIATDFAKSTERANDSIGLLKIANESLQRQLDSANSLRDDLAYLLDRGERTADRLEDLVRVARDKVGISPAPGVQTPAAEGEKMVGGEPVTPRAASVGSVTPGEPAVASSGPAAAQASAAKASEGDTDAEQALLRAIRSTG